VTRRTLVAEDVQALRRLRYPRCYSGTPAHLPMAASQSIYARNKEFAHGHEKETCVTHTRPLFSTDAIGKPQQVATKSWSREASNINSMAEHTKMWPSVDQQPASEVRKPLISRFLDNTVTT